MKIITLNYIPFININFNKVYINKNQIKDLHLKRDDEIILKFINCEIDIKIISIKNIEFTETTKFVDEETDIIYMTLIWNHLRESEFDYIGYNFLGTCGFFQDIFDFYKYIRENDLLNNPETIELKFEIK